MTTDEQKSALAASYESGAQERVDTAKVAKLLDSFTNNERTRYQSIRTKMEINLAKAYGSKLPTICVERLLDRALLDGDVYSAVVSGQDTYLPQSHGEWQTFVKESADSDWASRAALVSADYAWKNGVRQDALAGLSGPAKLAKERAGVLDDYLDAKVQEAEIERSGL